MDDAAKVIRSAIDECGEFFASNSAPFGWVDVEDHIINSLRANGYVIKRAVPPCRGYEAEEHNDA